ncbi:SDR family NAD(P)-dependent oxidoreductase [Phragmitibacter flavus]|uniref:SDR family NAD(P)-dependent oxidoreductase n=1 Tax=Phragmitibacter flavus TaxID=2576071 RepID=A0A5R8KG52_9BACT|nr:SDR family NAD(P)-dependent oxidoreductase [Phragmitibacter flavus]TLD71282.1 SDR family NAD(P)-dependent oxidoreductase [Phragmitibacter flavus]
MKSSKIGYSVMTGGTSGLGLVAARMIVERGNKLFVGKRSPGPAPVGHAIPLQLASIISVREFCRQVHETCNHCGIDLLVLNAGGNFPLEKTADGFEMNFAVNHLAHYLIVRELLPILNPGSRVLLTTSGTHDPEEGAAVPAPKHANGHRLAYPETDPDLDDSKSRAAGRAYSASKLCNLLTAQALARHALIRSKGIRVVAYSPGPTPGTGLVAARGLAIGLAFRYVLPLVAKFVPALHTPELAGSTLAELALGEIQPPDGQIYVLLKKGKVTFPAPSALARDENTITRMWSDSASLLDLQGELERA